MKKLVLLIFFVFFSCDVAKITHPESICGGNINVTNYLHSSIEIILDGSYKEDILPNCDSSYSIVDDGGHLLKIRTIPAGWEDCISFKISDGDTIKFNVTSSGIVQVVKK